MSAIYDQRCRNHREREAVARCPMCREFYCRECVTEHLGRVICAKCLADDTPQSRKDRARPSIVRAGLAAVSVLVVWTCFFLLGRSLLMLPDSFHDGTVWSASDPMSFTVDEP